MYSFFSRTGMLDVAKPIADAKAADYVGLLVLGGAKSPAILAISSPRRIQIMPPLSAARCSRFLKPADERMRGDRAGGGTEDLPDHGRQ